MFDAKRFLIDHFRTPTELVAFVRAFGQEPPKNEAVYKWFGRGAVPGEWLPMLLALLEMDRGAPVSIAGYVK
jgi:hypothetical protein